MTGSPLRLQLGLENLLADLQQARRTGDLGRLALLAYCEVRRWARLAGEDELAESSGALVTDCPHPGRAEFLSQVDRLIAGLWLARSRLVAVQCRLATPAPVAEAARLAETV